MSVCTIYQKQCPTPATWHVHTSLTSTSSKSSCTFVAPWSHSNLWWLLWTVLFHLLIVKLPSYTSALQMAAPMHLSTPANLSFCGYLTAKFKTLLHIPDSAFLCPINVTHTLFTLNPLAHFGSVCPHGFDMTSYATDFACSTTFVLALHHYVKPSCSTAAVTNAAATLEASIVATNSESPTHQNNCCDLWHLFAISQRPDCYFYWFYWFCWWPRYLLWCFQCFRFYLTSPSKVPWIPWISWQICRCAAVL